MRVLLIAASAASLALAGLAPAYAQPAPASPSATQAGAVTGAERREVVEALAKALQSRFVFPEIGARYAAMLRAKLASGAYDGLSDPEGFGKAVTADLQAVWPDGHLRLAPAADFQAARPPPTAADAPASTRPAGPPGLEETKMIGDVAYLRFNAFFGEPAQVKAARAFLLAHAGAKAVIIDARPNRGGGLDEMNAILPLLYSKRTTLVRMDTRAAIDSPLEQSPYLVRRASPPDVVRHDHVITPDAAEHRLQHAPVYYLTSRRTASAAEHLALAFKRTHRATLIGETTRGAGHYGGLETIGSRFAAFIPVGRSYDPATGWDWEGKGVAPDVAVPADMALEEALKEARAAGAHPTS